jgi:hypothetical protein
MELIWGEIAIGLKAVAEEMGHDLANDRELVRCVDVFQKAVYGSRETELSPDDLVNWEYSKHNNGYRAPEVVREMEEDDPTSTEQRAALKDLISQARNK